MRANKGSGGKKRGSWRWGRANEGENTLGGGWNYNQTIVFPAHVPSVTSYISFIHPSYSRHAFSSSFPSCASFVSRRVISRGAISTDDFHTLFVERFDERSIGVFRSLVGSERGHVVGEKERMARQADLPFPWEAANDWIYTKLPKSRYVHATILPPVAPVALLQLCTQHLRRTKRVVTYLARVMIASCNSTFPTRFL